MILRLSRQAAAAALLALAFAGASQSVTAQVRVYDGPVTIRSRPATGPTSRPATPAVRREPISVFPAKPTAILTGHRMDIKSIAWSRDGRRLASASEDRSVRLWDAASGKQLHVFEGHTGSVLGVDFSPDGKYLVSGGLDALAKVWEIETGEQIAEFAAHPRRVNCVAYHPDGKHVLTGCCDHLMRVWNVETETVVAKYKHDDCVRSIAVSKDGSIAVCGMEYGRIHLWDLKTQALLKTLEPVEERRASVNSLAISEDMTRVFSSSWYDGQVAWDWKREKQTHVYNDGGGGQLSITPDGNVAALAQGNLQFYDANSGRKIATLDLGRGGFRQVIFSPDGKRVAAGGDYWPEKNKSVEVVIVWDLAELLKLPPAPDEQ